MANYQKGASKLGVSGVNSGAISGTMSPNKDKLVTAEAKKEVSTHGAKPESTLMEAGHENVEKFFKHEVLLSKQMWFSGSAFVGEEDWKVYAEIKSEGQVPDAGTYPNLFGWIWGMAQCQPKPQQQQEKPKNVNAEPKKAQEAKGGKPNKPKVNSKASSSRLDELESKLSEKMFLSGESTPGPVDFFTKNELASKTIIPDPVQHPNVIGWLFSL